MLEKIKYVLTLEFINGAKTILGIVGVTVCSLLPTFGIEVPSLVLQGFALLLGAGFVHKLEKIKEKIEEIKNTLEQ